MKAHQRIIRERKAEESVLSLFPAQPDVIDIKEAEIKEVRYQTAKKIILEYEWLGTMGMTQIHYGIYYRGFLAGVNCFGILVAMQGYESFIGHKYSRSGIQLHRGACVHWAHEHSASKLIGESLKRLRTKGYRWCIAYSDSEAGEIGTVYQATNWHYLGIGTSKHFAFYRSDGKLFLDDADFYKMQTGMSYKAYAKAKGLTVKEQAPKGRYIYLMGNKKEKAEMMKTLKDKIQPYPKR